MNVAKWIIDLFGGKILEDAGKIIDNTSTSNEEKSKAKNELSKVIMEGLNRMNDAQRDVLVTELTGNKLQRLWRPLTMLIFVAVIVFHYFGYPIAVAFSPDLPELPLLDSKFWVLLEIGLGGYVIGRSVEKTAETVTKNIDLPFLRKKDRKEAYKTQAKNDNIEVEEGED